MEYKAPEFNISFTDVQKEVMKELEDKKESYSHFLGKGYDQQKILNEFFVNKITDLTMEVRRLRAWCGELEKKNSTVENEN